MFFDNGNIGNKWNFVRVKKGGSARVLWRPAQNIVLRFQRFISFQHDSPSPTTYISRCPRPLALLRSLCEHLLILTRVYHSGKYSRLKSSDRQAFALSTDVLSTVVAFCNSYHPLCTMHQQCYTVHFRDR